MSELKRYEFDVDWEDYEQSDGRFMLAAYVDKHLPKWVSVEDRLPEFDTEVLVYQPNWKGQLVTVAVFEGTDSSGYKFQFDLTNAMVHQADARYSVTHWMPLPEAPTEVSDE